MPAFNAYVYFRVGYWLAKTFANMAYRVRLGYTDTAALAPDAAHIRFFLGISHLMAGQDIAAIAELRATTALGDSPYLEEAHWYLAKALLRQKRLAAAEAELRTLIRLQGTGTTEARTLLAAIERLTEP